LAVIAPMTKEDFIKLWTNRYSDSVPISYTFRHSYPDRWFRIHSLPESKRYPDNEDEWIILLQRQNTIMTDILGNDSKILIITGDYHFEGHTELHPVDDVDSIKEFSFNKLDNVDLHKLWPDEYNDGQVFRPIFCDSTWAPHKFDNVLRDIAQDSVRAFFVSVDSDTLIIPYDGGVDLILKDSATRDKYKTKYTDWLSKRDDGL
jgi:hypothetical protein